MKQKLCMLLIAMMVFISIAPVYAVNDLTHLKSVKVVSFGYYNGETKITTSTLPSNTEITLKATVQKVGYNDYNSMRMILVIYNNGAMIGINSDNQKFPFVGAKKEFQASVTTPADTSACEIQAYLWSGYDTMIPIGDYSAIGKNNSDLSGILIDGVPLSGFNSTTYSYTLIDQIPKEIIPVCTDLGTTYTISQNEDEITIDTVAPNGSTKTYTITLQISNPVITNFSESYLNVDGNPDSRTATDAEVELMGYIKNTTYNYSGGDILAFSSEAEYYANANRAAFFQFHMLDQFPSELLGAKILPQRVRVKGQMLSTNLNCDMTFTINKSVTIYFQSNAALATAHGYTPTGYTQQQFKLRYCPTATSVPFAPADYKNFPNYKCNLIVPEGQASATFTIHMNFTGGTADYCSSVFALPYTEQLQSRDLASITDITEAFTNTSGLPDSRTATGLDVDMLGLLREPTYKYKDGHSRTYSTLDELHANVSRIGMIGYHYFENLPIELIGAQNIPGRVRVNGMLGTDKNVTLTFTTDKSIRVYFRSNVALAETYGYTETGYSADDFMIREMTTLSTAPYAPVPYSSQPNYMYDCIVPDGEENATFTIYMNYDYTAGAFTPCILAKPYENITVSYTNSFGESKTDNIISLGSLQYPIYNLNGGNIIDWNSQAEFKNYTSRVFTDRGYWYYTDFPAEMEGAQIIGLKNDYKNNQFMAHKIRLTLNKTSTLYFYCNSAMADDYGAQKLTGELRIVEQGSYSATPGTDNTLYSDIYKVELIVPAGEKEAQFEFEILGSSGTYGPVAFIK